LICVDIVKCEVKFAKRAFGQMREPADKGGMSTK